VLSGAYFTIRIPCSLLDLLEYINEISILILFSFNLVTQSAKATPYFVYNKSDDEENSDSNSDEEYSSSSESEEDEDPNYEGTYKGKTAEELEEIANELAKERELINAAMEKQFNGVKPKDNEELKELQNLNPKALNKANNSTEFLSKLDADVNARLGELYGQNIEDQYKEKETAFVAEEQRRIKGKYLEIPLAVPYWIRKKRAAEKSESNENSSTKRSRIDDENSLGTVRDNPDIDDNSGEGSSSRGNNSGEGSSSRGNNPEIYLDDSWVEGPSSSGNNTPKGKGKAPEGGEESPKGKGKAPEGGEESPKGDGGSPVDYVLEKQACDMPDIYDADGGD